MLPAMGQDLSTLFVPRPLEGALLCEVAAEAFARGPEDLVALIVDETTGPKALRDGFPRFSSVSLWSPDPAPWDAYARALSAKLPGESLLSVVMADHSCVGGWQLLRDGKAVNGVWSEEDYT